MLQPAPKNASPETTQSIFDVIAPFLGAGIAAVGIYVLYAFWQGRKRRKVVEAIRDGGSTHANEAEVGDDIWVRGVVSSAKVQTHPIDQSECARWFIEATHMVKEKVSNDAGHTDRRVELFRESAGTSAVLESKDGTVALSLDQCDHTGLEGQTYTAEDLPEDVRAWLSSHDVDLDARELEVQVLQLPIGVQASALGHVRRIDDDGVRWLDDSGPTGLAIAVDGLDGYIDSLASGQIATLLVGLFFLGGGAALIGRFFAA